LDYITTLGFKKRNIYSTRQQNSQAPTKRKQKKIKKTILEMDEENKNVLPKNEEEKKGENGMRRKQSESSLASLDVTNEDEVDGDEEEEEGKDVVVLGPVVGLKEQLEKDKVLIFLSKFISNFCFTLV
jgi:hypothetical protein